MRLGVLAAVWFLPEYAYGPLEVEHIADLKPRA